MNIYRTLLRSYSVCENLTEFLELTQELVDQAKDTTDPINFANLLSMYESKSQQHLYLMEKATRITGESEFINSANNRLNYANGIKVALEISTEKGYFDEKIWTAMIPDLSILVQDNFPELAMRDVM